MQIKGKGFIKKFKEKSKITEEDALRLGRELNKAIYKARERMRKGNFVTEKEARKRLGLKMNKKQIKEIDKLSWDEITRPLKEAPKKIKEDEVVDLIHRLRKKK